MGGKIEKKSAAAKTVVAKKSASATKLAASKKASPAKKEAASKTAAKTTVAKKSAPAKTQVKPAPAKKVVAPKSVPEKKEEPEKFSAWSNAKTVKKTKKEVEAEKKTAARMAKSAEESEKKLAAAKQIDPASQREKKEVQDYGDDKIKHLDALEHIRLRSGMYIGRLGNGSNENDGIYVLMKEVIDNSIDEFIVGFGKQIDVSVADGRVKVRDYGRGIPLGKVVECVSQINTGAKYNDDVFQFSVGMNGVGTKAVNALSSYFRVVSVRDGKCTDAVGGSDEGLDRTTGR